MNRISKALGDHYSSTFAAHGRSSRGVDWGADQARLDLRYHKMLAVMTDPPGPGPAGRTRLLDVGCGFGGLLDHAQRQGIELDYTGIDLAANMVAAGREAFPDATFLCGDILETEIDGDFDFVVCNGILTQKLDVPKREMDAYARALIRRLFDLARVGVAFNVMTSHVNFFADNLYYRDPASLMAWCLEEVTPRLRLDHAYPLYEYTVYLFRDPA